MLPGATSNVISPQNTLTPEEINEFLEYKKQKELLKDNQRQQLLNASRVATAWPAGNPIFGSPIGPMNSLHNIVIPKIIPNGVQLPVDRPNDVNNFLLTHGHNPLLQQQKNYWPSYNPGIVQGISASSIPQSIASLSNYIPTPSLSSVQNPISLANFINPLTQMSLQTPIQTPVQTPVASLQNQIQETVSLPSSATTPRINSPKRSSSPIDVETIEPEVKKQKTESEENQEENSDFVARTTNMLPSLNHDPSPEAHHSCDQVCQHQDDGEPVETHIIITARPPAFLPIDHDEKMSSDSESDYDTNLRPQETALQYKDRMMERAMKKNLASKRSREKRKREHEKRQLERQKLEQRNIELASKLMELKETLNRLKPQICSSCNEQVQSFLDQHQKTDGMNIFVLRPCFKPDCRGNKNYNATVKKTETES